MANLRSRTHGVFVKVNLRNSRDFLSISYSIVIYKRANITLSYYTYYYYPKYTLTSLLDTLLDFSVSSP